MHERLVALGGRGVRVRRLGGDRAGEIRLTRFLRNASVQVDEMLETAQARVSEAVAGRHILAIQDTTVTRSNGGGGSYLHAMIAVDAENGAMLGVLDAHFLHRTEGRKAERQKRPFHEKESARWLEAARTASKVCAGAARVTVVADREGDIYEAFAGRPEETHLVIRAAHDRSLDDGGKLFQKADGWPSAGRVELALPGRPGHRARKAQLVIRFGEVELKRPHNASKHGPLRVRLTLIDLGEDAPGAGVTPVHWRLLTTHKVKTLEDALAVADIYRRRWNIEQLFRTMKSKGFDIEALRIVHEGARNKLIMATFIAAVTVLQMTHARDGAASGTLLRPMSDAFEPEDSQVLKTLSTQLEGKTQRQKNPHPPNSLAFAAWVCARLGGWTGYYGKPGPITILNGWLDFQNIKRGSRLTLYAKNV